MYFRQCCLIALLSLVQNAYQITYVCDSTAQCGCSQNPVAANVRIVNGEEAGLNTWSWAVSLHIDGGICGGTIIDPYFVVTAAHCLRPATQPEDITIYAGTLIIDQGITRKASRIYSHPDYDAFLVANDIALLKVDRPFDLSSGELARICLPSVAFPSEEYPAPNTSLVIVGWGSVSEGGSVSRRLRQVTIQAVGSKTAYCKKTIKNPMLQFCAGTMPEGGKGECTLRSLHSQSRHIRIQGSLCLLTLSIHRYVSRRFGWSDHDVQCE